MRYNVELHVADHRCNFPMFISDTYTDSSMVDNDVVARIAKKIRATRLEKKLTIQQLANRTRVSKGLLSKIENMRTVPSLPVFVTLIQSLDVSLKDFFKDLVQTDGKGYQLVRKEQYKDHTAPGHNGISHHQILVQSTHYSNLKIALISIEAGKTGKISTSADRAIVFLLSGLCQLSINDDEVTLNEGDVISFDGSTDNLVKSEVSTSMLQFIMGH
jgi:transcriptional regulator with XRE-family HTH domain